MRNIINTIFPKSANNNYQGGKLAKYIFLLIAIVGLIRSSIHFLAPDGGAGSIAGIDLSVTGSSGIIFAFSLWGSAQLLYAFIQIAVYLRYKTLIPFMYILIFLETIFRMFIGYVKPVNFTYTPPGAISNYIMVPLSIIMFLLSLNIKGRSKKRSA